MRGMDITVHQPHPLVYVRRGAAKGHGQTERQAEAASGISLKFCRLVCHLEMEGDRFSSVTTYSNGIQPDADMFGVGIDLA